MKIYYDKDADLEQIRRKRVAVIGYGSQGHAHAHNLKDSGVGVVVGLREGASWQKAEKSGLKVMPTADAVKSAYVRTITIGLGAGSVLGTFVTDPETQIVIVDPSTLRFDLGAPSPAFQFCAASIWGTGVVSPEAFKHSTGSNDQGHEWLQSHAAGTGPYMLESVEPGNKVVFVQNPDYWRGWSADNFKKVIVQQIPDGTARREAMESGAADLAVPSRTPADTTAMRGNTTRASSPPPTRPCTWSTSSWASTGR